MRENTLQIFADDDRWLTEVDDLATARVACETFADDGEALPLRVEGRGRLAAKFDLNGFTIFQKGLA